jgi:hypothetical protein
MFMKSNIQNYRVINGIFDSVKLYIRLYSLIFDSIQCEYVYFLSKSHVIFTITAAI